MQPQVKIISGDMRGRNGLKSKVSTSEELYDFFSEKILKNYIVRCDFWSCRHFVDRLLLHVDFCGVSCNNVLFDYRRNSTFFIN